MSLDKLNKQDIVCNLNKMMMDQDLCSYLSINNEWLYKKITLIYNNVKGIGTGNISSLAVADEERSLNMLRPLG